jgi:predicted nucleic-acid-binding Zn-ribbon protein
MPTSPLPGKWYIVVTCSQCNSTVFLFRDLTDGKSALNARYFITCPSCGRDGEYEGRHYLHPGEGE